MHTARAVHDTRPRREMLTSTMHLGSLDLGYPIHLPVGNSGEVAQVGYHLLILGAAYTVR